MSGICAIVNLNGAPGDAAALDRMLAAGRSRGPDGSRARIHKNVALGHLALHATPEASRERQPVCDSSEDVWLVADVRLDNRDELIVALRPSGLLASEIPTDPDLLLAAYLRWGDDCAGRLDGDFAFAVWDGRSRRLFCATDPFATKPLHFARCGDVVCVASEAQQILQHPAFPARLDEVAVGDFLVGNCGDAERTMFVGVRRLPAAHRLAVTRDGERLERFWDLDPERRIRCRGSEEYAEAFSELLQRAVGTRLRSPGEKVGIFVSGGLDSGAVAAVAQKLLSAPEGKQALTGYSYSFDRLSVCDERAYSSSLTEELGVPIRYVNAEQFPVLDGHAEGDPPLETPFVYTQTLLLEMLGRMRAEGARVVLTGHGGDSLLQGSRLLYLDRLQRGDWRVFPDLYNLTKERGIPFLQPVYRYLIRPLLPAPLLRTIRRLAGRTQDVPGWITPAFARKAQLRERVRQAPAPRRFPSRALQEQYEMVIALRGVGRATYAYDRLAHGQGLEPRHPLLDRRLAEFVLAIPPEQVYQPGVSKSVLRRALLGVLPDPIRLRRDKAQFEPYFRYSFVETNRPLIQGLLEDPLIAQMGFCSAPELQRAYSRYVDGACTPTEGMMLLMPVLLERWLRLHRHAIV